MQPRHVREPEGDTSHTDGARSPGISGFGVAVTAGHEDSPLGVLVGSVERRAEGNCVSDGKDVKQGDFFFLFCFF